MILTRKAGTVLILMTALLATTAQAGSLKQHVEYLASPELEGRLTGTPGAAKAADFIIQNLTELGALPLPGQKDFRLPFDFTAGMNDAGTTLSLDGTAKVWEGTETVQALSFSDTNSASGPVVFAGYGLSLPDDSESPYDSYVGLDVTDKIVMVLRYFPEDVEQETRVTLARYAGLRYKAMHARELGAKAMLVVTGPRSPNAGLTVPMTFDTALAGSGIVAASINQAVADAIFAHVEGKSLEQVQESLDSGNPHVQGFDIPGLTVTVDAKVEREQRKGYNVVGYLPRSTEEESSSADEEYVVLGAHYDHLGHGKHGNSLAKKEEAGKTHFGADDNASGVATLLEAGAQLAKLGRPRPVVLAFWTGEELGLLGSTDFVKGGVLPTEKIAAYLNLDMVGRMQDNRLNLQAVGSSTAWPRVIEQANVVVGFDVRIQEDPYLPTDSSAFYQAGVPTVSFFTGSHEDYHRPSDTAETLNYEDLERVVQFATLLSRKVAGLEQVPDYVKVDRKAESGGNRDSVRAFTGTIPDYATEVEGLRLSGVIGGGPADQAGLREGDVIVEFAGQKITNIYDYTYALDAVKVDKKVKVVFLREGSRHEVEITPTSRR